MSVYDLNDLECEGGTDRNSKGNSNTTYNIDMNDRHAINFLFIVILLEQNKFLWFSITCFIFVGRMKDLLLSL